MYYGRFRILAVVLEKKNEAFPSFGLFVTKEKRAKSDHFSLASLCPVTIHKGFPGGASG